MTEPFFPGPLFGWAFSGTLFALLVVAAFTDLKWLVIPKWLTLPMLAGGFALNMVRAGLVAGSGAGVLKGFLFALGGFGGGFGLFLAMWLLGTCGGGDVKLFAALGSWIGPLLAVYVLCGTLICVVLLSLLQVARGLVTAKTNGSFDNRKRKRLIAFGLPVALSAVLVVLWVFRVELRLAAAPVRSENSGSAAAV